MYAEYVRNINRLLEALVVTNQAGEEYSVQDGFDTWVKCTHDVSIKKQVMHMVGNGASATMASHMAADASKNGQIRARAYNDAALLSAVGNDLAYEEVFAMPIDHFGDADDVLITISSSGNSPNIIRAIEAARKVGMQIITLSGMKENNRSRSLGDINFFIPGATYGLVECTHQIVLHYWLDLYITRHINSAPKTLQLP